MFFRPCIALTLILSGLLFAELDQEPKGNKPRPTPEALRAQAKELEEEGELDEAVGIYALLFTRHKSAANMVEEALNMEGWLRLLWERNKPETDKDIGDRKAALKAGKNFIELTKGLKEKWAGEELGAWKRVEALVEKYELELDWEKKFASYLGVFEKTDDPEEKGETLMLMIELLMEHQEHKRALEKCQLLFDKKQGISVSKWNRGHLYYYMGLCHEGLGQNEDALGCYARTWAAYMGMVAVSAPAMEGWMRILWERNTPGGDRVMGDRRGACEGGRQYIEQTKRFEDKMREDDLRLWKRVKDLTEAYEAQLGRREPKSDPASKGLLR